MNELIVKVENKDGKLVVGSRVIAEQLDKEHKHVLAKIKECLNIEDGHNFGAPIEAIKSTYLTNLSFPSLVRFSQKYGTDASPLGTEPNPILIGSLSFWACFFATTTPSTNA